MSDYSDILNRKKTSDKLGDAFSKQADSMRPLNVGQRREQALLRGLGVGLNNDDEREAKLAELEEQYKQVDAINRELTKASGKNQLREQKIKSFIADQDSNLKLASDLIVKGKYDQLDILAPSIFKAYNEYTGTNLGEYLFSKNGHISFKTPAGKIETMEAKTLFNPIMNYIPPEDRGNYKGFATSYQAEELDAIVEARRLRNELLQSQSDNMKAHGELYKAQSDPQAIQAEIDYKNAQANKLNQEALYVGKDSNKELLKKLQTSNIDFLEEAHSDIKSKEKQLGAYENIGKLITEEFQTTWNRSGAGLISKAQRFLNPSFTDASRRQAQIEMEKEPLYHEIKKIFTGTVSDKDVALFVTTLPDLNNSYEANMTIIENRKKALEEDLFKIKTTRDLIQNSDYSTHFTHTSIQDKVDQMNKERLDKIEKEKLKVNGKIKIDYFGKILDINKEELPNFKGATIVNE